MVVVGGVTKEMQTQAIKLPVSIIIACFRENKYVQTSIEESRPRTAGCKSGYLLAHKIVLHRLVRIYI